MSKILRGRAHEHDQMCTRTKVHFDAAIAAQQANPQPERTTP